MLGPVRRLRSASDKSKTKPWVFIAPPGTRKAGRMIERLIFAITILWAA
jgi:hypothetical protein